MPNLEWHRMRTDAERVRCPHCKAHPGASCRNPHTGAEIALPAHMARSKLAAGKQGHDSDRPAATHSD